MSSGAALANQRPARWLFPNIDEQTVATLQREIGVSRLAAAVLAARGYSDPAGADRFLRPNTSQLHDPFRLLGMRPAVARIAQAVRNREPILLYGDYDVDGTTSIVTLKKALEIAGASADYHVPHRLRDGYGMHPEAIRSAAEKGTRLIISVDTGIRATAVVDYARELGMDVIVTDHHLPDCELPRALAVINPNQPGCDYPEKNLCGAGVALKLVQALLHETGVPAGRARQLVESFLKLTAIATVADVVPLTGENRVIVKCGLAGLASTPNPGLRALLEVSGFAPGAAPTAGQVAFRVAPRINAAGRMASATDVIEMFLTADAGKARELAARLHSLNYDRRDTEAGILDDILVRCQETPVTDDRRGLVFAGDGWHKGVVGIVASRIVERFHRPTFVLGIDAETGQVQGSGRSVPAFHLLEALESMAEIFDKFGGHRQAAGVTLSRDRLAEFEQRFNERACAVLAPEDLRATHHIDAETRFDELDERSVGEIFQMAPFGYGNPAPLLAARNVDLPQAPGVMKEHHLRFGARQNGRLVTMKAWNWADRAHRLAPGVPLDLAFSIEPDDWSGFSATLRDAALAGQAG